MDWLNLVLGSLIVAIVVLDFIYTTVSLSGAGPISRLVSETLWSIAQILVNAAGTHAESWLRGAVGAIVLCGVALTWITLNLLGYWLMFMVEGALVYPDGSPASSLDRAAFAGSALSTLGASVVEPGHGGWDLLSMIAAVNGMIVLTLSVSFLMNVTQTVRRARLLAVRVNILLDAVENQPLSDRRRQLSELGADLLDLALALNINPMAGLFAPRDRSLDLPLVLPRLASSVEVSRPSEEQDPVEFTTLISALRLLVESQRHADEKLNTGIKRWAAHYSLTTEPA